MSRRRLPAGARVSSFTGLSLRALRARPLRAVLTAGAIVLGVGMVFGVLLLVGTIHSTFDRLYDSVYGKTDIVVSGEQSVGSLPEPTIDRVRRRAGRGGRLRVSVYSVFRIVDARGEVEARADGPGLRLGRRLRATRHDQRPSGPRGAIRSRAASEIELPADWAESTASASAAGCTLSTPTGLVTLRVAGLFEFEGGLDFGGYGLASMPLADARKVMDKPGVWDEIDVTVEPGASVDEVRRELDSALGRGVEVATPATKGEEAQKQIAASTSSSTSSRASRSSSARS